MCPTHEANTKGKGCREAPTSVLGATQQACSAPPPAPVYLRTQKARRGLETFSTAAASSGRHRSPESRGPRRSPQVAARRGASFGGQPPRLARPPRAWRGLGLPCGHRSHSRTGSRTSAARTATRRHPRQEVALRRDWAPQPRPARESRGGAGRGKPRAAAPAPGEPAGTQRVGAPQPPLRSGVRQLPAHPLDVIRPRCCAPRASARAGALERRGRGLARALSRLAARPAAAVRTAWAEVAAAAAGRPARRRLACGEGAGAGGAEAPRAGGTWLRRSLATCWVAPLRTLARGEGGRRDPPLWRARGQRRLPWSSAAADGGGRPRRARGRGLCRAPASVTGPGRGPEREVGVARPLSASSASECRTRSCTWPRSLLSWDRLALASC